MVARSLTEAICTNLFYLVCRA